MEVPLHSYRKPDSFYVWEQQLVNGGAHAEQAVQDDAEKKQPRGGPCERGAHNASDDVSADKSHDNINDCNAAETNGVNSLSGNAERIPVLA